MTGEGGQRSQGTTGRDEDQCLPREMSKEEKTVRLDVTWEGSESQKATVSKWQAVKKAIHNCRLISVEELDLEGKQQWMPYSVYMRLAQRCWNSNAFNFNLLGDRT